MGETESFRQSIMGLCERRKEREMMSGNIQDLPYIKLSATT